LREKRGEKLGEEFVAEGIEILSDSPRGEELETDGPKGEPRFGSPDLREGVQYTGWK
jgi:hypothetical protein